MLTSSTAFDVTKGEDAPEIGDTGPVTGIAYKDCSWKVPYKVRDPIWCEIVSQVQTILPMSASWEQCSRDSVLILSKSLLA